MKKILLALALLLALLATPAFATSELKKTICPSGCDYTTLAAAVTAQAQNLVSADKYLSLEIQGDWSGGADTAAVTFSSYTTDATRYINLYTTGAARHAGVYSTSKYVLSTGASTAITASVDYITIDGLQISTTTGRGIYVPDSYHVNQTVKNNIIRSTSNAAGGGYYNPNPRGTYNFINNVIYGFATNYGCGINAADGGGDGSTTINIYHNTAYGNWSNYCTHVTAGTTVNFKNNISSNYDPLTIGAGSADIVSVGDITAGSNNICSGSSNCTASPLTSGTNNATSYSAYYVTAGSDFHIKDINSILYNAGVTIGAVTTDFESETRPQATTYDIGADEFTASGGGGGGGGVTTGTFGSHNMIWENI